MTPPMQTMASNVPVSAAARAACGISYAPGTSNTWTFASAAPASVSARTAASRMLLVIASLKRETITANLSDDASPSGARPSFCLPMLSASLEDALTLLEKRLRPSAHVLGPRHQAEERGLEELRLGQ